MKKIVCDNYEEACQAAADIFAAQLEKKPESVLGLATGSTPIGLYEEFVSRNEKGQMDFSQVRAFNLDEYYPIKANNPQSYHAFMEEHLFSKVKFASTRILNGESPDPGIECARFDAELDAAGGLDLLLLGIGQNGHVGFNEPADSYPLGSYLVHLTEDTITVNSRFCEDGENLPASAITMGMGQIFSAKKILLLITGESKAKIAKKLFEGKVFTDVSASFLLLHPDITVVLDKAAYGD